MPPVTRTQSHPKTVVPMNCPHCNDAKQGEFPGIGVRCKACNRRFYAARNGVGYVSAPWFPWLLVLVLPLAGGGVIWGVARFASVGDYGQVLRILVTLVTGLVFAECIRRYATVPEV